MSDTVNIRIQSTFDAKGSQAAAKAVADLAAASQKAAGGAASTAAAKQAAAYAKVQQAASQVAVAEQRKAAATSNAAAADSRAGAAAANKAAADSRAAAAAINVAAADQRKATATANATAAQARAEKAALSLAQAQAKAASGANSTASYFSQMGDAVASSLTSIVGPAAVVTTAIAGIKGAADLAVVGANADLVRQRFDQLAASAGTTGQALLGALRSASGGEISDLNLQLAANRAQLLGVADSAQEFGVLMNIARDRAQQMGISTTQAFNDLVTGLGRGSALILDNLGITVSVTEANAAYAASLGKSADALTEAESKQALINAVLAQGQASLDATGGAVQSHAGTYAQLGAATENAKNSLGSFLSNVLEPSAQKLAATAEGVNNLFTWLNNLGSASTDVATRQAAATAATEAYERVIAQGGSTAEASAAAQAALATAVAGTVPVTQQAAQATFVAMSASEQYAVQARAAAVAGQMKADADRVAAVDAQTHAIADKQLEESAMAAARALLQAGPAGANTANMLAGSSSLVDQLTAAYYRLYAAQQAAGVKGVGGGGAKAAGGASAQAIFVERQTAAEKARQDQIIATGSALQKVSVLQQRYNDAVKRYGANSAEAISAQTSLIQAQQSGASGRASAAAAGGSKLEQLEAKTGDKLADIDADTQQKLIDIDRKAAEERARIIADLNAKIAKSAADRRVSNEVDDLELIGVTDPAQAAKLNDREAAQAKAREREVAAAKEAQEMIAAGEAEAASKIYETRQKQIDEQQQLDEKYADRKRELAEDPAALDALKTQYDEATRAIDEQAATQIGIDKAAIAEKQAAAQAEKDSVIAAAEEQKNQVVSKAQESAAGIMKASGDAKTKATADLKAIGDAVAAIPTQKTITITVNQQGDASGGGKSSSGKEGTSKAAGGGTFLTSGPTTLTVGDNPGGVEVVSVTPISGKGQTRVGGGLAKLAGGGIVVVDAGDGYTTPVAGTGKPAGGGKGKGKGAPAPADPKAVRDAIKESIELIKLQNELRKVQAEAARLRPAPINYAWIEGLATEAQEITRIVTSKLLPLKKDEAEALSKYASASGQAADVLKTIAELRTMQAKAKEERPGPIIEGYIVGLANEAQKITQIVRDRLIPSTELESEMYSAYADAVSSSVSVLKDVADLRKVQADTVGTRGLLPNRDLWYISLADEAVRIAKIVRSRAVPATEEERDALSAFADVVGSSVGVLKDVSGLTADMFADYQSPTDAQLSRLVTDADRVARVMTAAAARYDTKGLEAAKAFTDALGGTFGVFKDGLLAFDAINSGDFVLDTGKLAQFSDASLLALDTVSRLAARATQISPTSITALQGATSALSGLAEAGVKLAAVPFGNLADISRIFSGGGGGGGPTNINNTFVLPPGSNRDTANEVIRILNQQTNSRRA